jgi:hypothetical protein
MTSRDSHRWWATSQIGKEYHMAMSLSGEDKQWIRELLAEQLSASEARYREQLEGVETRLLTEFHKWASPFESRQRTHGAAIRTLDTEYESLADRVRKLEEKQKPTQ